MTTNEQAREPRTIAQRLRHYSLMMKSSSADDVQAAAEQINALIVAQEPLECMDDALALQCFAIELANMMASGAAPSQAGTNIMELMRVAMNRVAAFLEAGAVSTTQQTYFGWSLQAPTVH